MNRPTSDIAPLGTYVFDDDLRVELQFVAEGKACLAVQGPPHWNWVTLRQWSQGNLPTIADVGAIVVAIGRTPIDR
jgi:hypothetical protein